MGSDAYFNRLIANTEIDGYLGMNHSRWYAEHPIQIYGQTFKQMLSVRVTQRKVVIEGRQWSTPNKENLISFHTEYLLSDADAIIEALGECAIGIIDGLWVEYLPYTDRYSLIVQVGNINNKVCMPLEKPVLDDLREFLIKATGKEVGE